MCGICGFAGFEDHALLKQMMEVIRYRGPDESGTYSNENISLGHQRLSIIDLNTGRQPVHDEDESIWVVHNGEIYNFPELREELEKKGHRFYTETDTEVLVHAYEEHGSDCIKRFNGMFAFALWDSCNKRLMLARDRAGIKPMYYTLIEDGVFIFASEIKSILQHKKVRREVDLDALDLIVNLMYLPGEKTMFKGIKKLPPGHILSYERGDISIRKYSDFYFKPTNKSEGYYVRRLRRALEEAVKRHMISDVPVGSFLSGGLDTSTLVALMSKFSEEPIKTICMGFGEEADELADARLVSEHFGTEHYEFTITPKKGLDVLEKAIWHSEIPKINLHPYFAYKLASKKVKVCMSGSGGDELFAGYFRRYNAVVWANRVKKILPGIISKNLFAKLRLLDRRSEYNYFWALSSLDDWASFYLILYADILNKNELGNLYQKNIDSQGNLDQIYSPFFDNNLHPVDKVLLADIKTQLVDNYLVVDDTMSMANSLEIRVPFLDSEVIDFSCQIPWNIKVRDGVGKYVLRKAMSDILPREVFAKQKRGFGMTSYYWFRDELIEEGKNLSESKAITAYFKGSHVKKLMENISKARHRDYQMLMTLLAFDVWHKMYIEEEI